MIPIQLSKLTRYFLYGLSFTVLLTNTAQAYLDPGTGSYLFQLIIAGLLGGLFALKTWWRSVKSFFQRHRRDKKMELITEEDDTKKNG